MAPLSQPGQQQRWLAVAAGGKPRAKRNAAAAGAAAAGRKDATVVERAAVPDRPPTAVVLLNLGGPGSQEEVYPFLRRLFADKEIIPLGPLQSKPWGGIGRFIANRRTPSIQAQYREMDTGGGSPIKFWTESQGAEMVKHLDQISPDTAPHKYYISFRYASPLTEDALQEMDKDGVTRAVAFTQYPQFSCATTGSSLNELWRQLRDQGMMNRFDWSVVDRWPTHPGLIKAFAENITKGLEQFEPEVRDDVVLLYSAHSLPMSTVDRGDPYPQEVAATVQAVQAELGFSNSYRLVWQSKVGPSAWLGMQTDSAIKGCARLGIRHIMLIPIAFTSDHVETLFEIDIEYQEEAEELGMEMRRAPSLNLSPTFTRAMADIVSAHLNTDDRCTKQYPLRCPGCINPSCDGSKRFFTQQGFPGLTEPEDAAAAARASGSA